GRGSSLRGTRGESVSLRHPGPPRRRATRGRSRDVGHPDLPAQRLGLLGRADLRRTTALALLGDDLPVHEELAAPNAPRLTPRDGRAEARLAHDTARAERLGARDVADVLREEEF